MTALDRTDRASRPSRTVAAIVLALGLGVSACSGSGSGGTAGGDDARANDQAATVAGETVDAVAAAALLDAPPAGLAIIDVRTPEEFDAGHIDGAQLLDFSAADFAGRVAELDRDTPYFIYCKSGNRSGQALALMEDLGFTDVTNLDGGIQAWTDAGYQARS